MTSRGFTLLASILLLGCSAPPAAHHHGAPQHWFTQPPPWYYPVRQSLGFALLQAGRAAEAEAVDREDLRRNPENGWSLFGLARSLRAQGQSADAAAVEARLRLASAHADVTLMASRL
jgi:predicted Zn-dependent protease